MWRMPSFRPMSRRSFIPASQSRRMLVKSLNPQERLNNMTYEQRVQIKQNALVVISLGTLITLAAGIFYIGQQFERTNSRINSAVTSKEFSRWERSTERLNGTWRGAGIEDYHRIAPSDE